MTGTWIVRVTEAAEADFRAIILWTSEHFGKRQAQLYGETIESALAALSVGPLLAGGKARDDIGPGIFLLHVARRKRKGRHLLMCRATRKGEERIVEVLRILHDSMDLPRHVPQQR